MKSPVKKISLYISNPSSKRPSFPQIFEIPSNNKRNPMLSLPETPTTNLIDNNQARDDNAYHALFVIDDQPRSWDRDLESEISTWDPTDWTNSDLSRPLAPQTLYLEQDHQQLGLGKLWTSSWIRNPSSAITMGVAAICVLATTSVALQVLL